MTQINKVSSREAKAALGLIHVDIVAPLAAASIDDSRYYLTVVDDHSRFVTVVALNNRGLPVGRSIYYLKHTQRLLGKTVHTIRSDNEFSTAALSSFCHSEGIKHEGVLANSS